MMKSEKCGCPHHWVTKVLGVLGWVSGVLFFWSTWGGRVFWGFDGAYWAWAVVVLVLLAKVSRNCGCCCGSMHCGMCGMNGKQM